MQVPLSYFDVHQRVLMLESSFFIKQAKSTTSSGGLTWCARLLKMLTAQGTLCFSELLARQAFDLTTIVYHRTSL